MGLAVEQDVLVYLVRVHADVGAALFHDDLGQRFELMVCGDTTGRVGWEVEDDQLGPGADQIVKLGSRDGKILFLLKVQGGQDVPDLAFDGLL